MARYQRFTRSQSAQNRFGGGRIRESGLSLRQVSAWSSRLGLAELSNTAVQYRLNQAAGFLSALVQRLLAAKEPGADLRWPGRSLRLADGTCISKPGSKGTDWRVHAVFDLGRGGFSHLYPKSGSWPKLHPLI